jgi:hypothetical protein
MMENGLWHSLRHKKGARKQEQKCVKGISQEEKLSKCSEEKQRKDVYLNYSHIMGEKIWKIRKIYV